MKLRKIKFKIDLKAIFDYILLIAVTSVILFSILISLPLTEKFLNGASYDLSTLDDSYWSKEYTLSLTSNDVNDAEKVRDILFRRLNRYGVENVSTFKMYDDDKKSIKVILQTSKSKDIVEEILRNPFQIQIVTRKDDVDFNNEEDPYAYMMADNYNTTGWVRKDFRNVYITELPTSSGDKANFAMFKTWITKNGAFQKFLTENNGKYIGLSIDGFVTPFLVPEGPNKVFAIPISTTDPEQVKAIDILYNSGSMPSMYTVTSEKDLDVDLVEINYIYLSIGLFVALLVTYIFLFISKNISNNIVIKTFLATILSISLYISILKILQIPIDLFILAIDVLLVAILTKVLCENNSKNIYVEIMIVILGLLLMILGIGYQRVLGFEIIKLLLLVKISLIFSSWYINKVKDILKK